MTADGRRGPPAQVRRLDDRPEEPVLRQGRGEPLLGALLRPRHRGPARRHAGDEPAEQPGTARRPGREPGREQVQPEGAGEDDLQEPDVPARGDAERVQQGGQAVVRPVLPEAAAGRGGVRRGVPGDRKPVRRSPACRRTRNAPGRAMQLPDESFQSYFLDVFGRPAADQRVRVRAGERGQPGDDPAPAQQPGGAGQDRPRRRPGRRSWRRTPGRTRRRSTELFLLAVGKQADDGADWSWRWSTSPRTSKDKKLAYENILWALLNSKAFLFNQ